MGESLIREYDSAKDEKYKIDPKTSMLTDSLGFRRGAGALSTILEDNNIADHPSMAQAKIRYVLFRAF